MPSFTTPANLASYFQSLSPDAQQSITTEAQKTGRNPVEWLTDHINSEPTSGWTQGFNQYAQQHNLPSTTGPTPAQTVQTGAPPLDFNQLTAQTGGPANISAGLPAPTVGGNYNMNEAGGQTGGYSSTGATNQTQQGQQSTNSSEASQQTGVQTNQQNTTQNQATTGSTVGSTTGTNTGTTAQQSTGVNTTAQQSTGGQTGTQTQTGKTSVDTPFDIQSLVGGQLGDIAQADQQRGTFLTDFMNTGGTGFASQTDKAIRQATSGPGMLGAGNSATSRAAGYAAADVARNNAGQRLQAAQQLSGPTGLGTAVQTSAPLYGKSTSDTSTGQSSNYGSTVGTGTTSNNTTGQTANTSSGTSTQNTTGNVATTGSSSGVNTSDLNSLINKASSSLDFQSLVGNEAQQGTAVGSSASVGSGNVPESTPVKSGGCVVCTAYVSLGQMKPGAIRRAVQWKISKPRYGVSVAGYMLYGPALARQVQKNGLFAKLFKGTARSILYHEVYLSSPNRLKWKAIPCITHTVFDYLSWPVGLLSKALKLDTGVRCTQVRALLKSQNLEFAL